jgi:membrane protease YdiL (CAAX protease family)
MSERLRFSWRLFWILFAAAVVGIVAIVPFALELIRPILAQVPPSPIPIPLAIVIGAVQNLALLALFVGVGLRLSAKLGLGAELTQAWLDGEQISTQFWKVVRSGLVAGIIVGVVLVPLIIVLSHYLPNLPFVTAAKISIWKRFLAGFYGGIYEEILSRLFLLSLFAWLINRSWRKPRGDLGDTAFWSANVIVAILFGLGHLPSASMVMPITTLVVVAALVLNGFAALVFGWLYRVRGLEAAMIAHFTADFILYVIGPQFL